VCELSYRGARRIKESAQYPKPKSNYSSRKSTSPKTLLPQLHLLPHAAPTIDATHCQVAGDSANNGADLHHRSSSDGGFASLKCAEHHSMASMFASLLRLVNIVLLRCYQAIAVDIHHQNMPPKTINSITPHITVTPFSLYSNPFLSGPISILIVVY